TRNAREGILFRLPQYLGASHEPAGFYRLARTWHAGRHGPARPRCSYRLSRGIERGKGGVDHAGRGYGVPGAKPTLANSQNLEPPRARKYHEGNTWMTDKKNRKQDRQL